MSYPYVSDAYRLAMEFHQQLRSTCGSIFILHHAETDTHELGNCRSGRFEWINADFSRRLCPRA